MARKYRPYRKYSHRQYRRRSYRRRKATPVPMPIFLATAVVLIVTAGFVNFGYSADLGLMVLFGGLSIVTAIILSLAAFFGWRQYQKLRAFSVADIDRMDGIEFEHYLQKLLSFVGYIQVSVTQGSGDFGADLLATREGLKYAVQAKRYKGKVGVEAVYQVMGGQAYYSCQRTMVITNSKFTKAAHELAKKSGCILVDRNQLRDWVWQFSGS
jgi:restriction system protein